MLQFKYRVFDYPIAAIRSTLDYADIKYDVEVSNEETPSLHVEDDETDIVLRGWKPIFLYVSRRAHTWPQTALFCAQVEELVRIACDADMETLEAVLGTDTWLGGFEESTAADFLCIHRLRMSGDKLPDKLRTYVLRDPTLATKDEDDEGHGDGIPVVTFCTIS